MPVPRPSYPMIAARQIEMIARESGIPDELVPSVSKLLRKILDKQAIDERLNYQWLAENCCGGGGGGDPVSPTTVLSQLFATAGAQSSYTTSSVSPAQNRAYVLFFYDHASATPAVVPSAVGCGLTWTPVYSSTVSDPGTRLTVFKGVGAPTGGTITVTLGHSNGVSAGVILLALAGIDNTNPVVQASHGEAFAGMSLSVTLSAFSSASNRPVGFFAVAETTGAANFTAGTDFSIISGAHSSAAGTSDNYDISVNAEWRDAEDNVVDGSVSLVNEWKWLVALELRAG